MNKLFFYGAVALSFFSAVTLPSLSFAQDTVEASQAAEVTIEELEAALNADTPDLALIDSLVKALVAQDSSNVSKVTSLVQNAPASVKATVNNSLTQAAQSSESSNSTQGGDAQGDGQESQEQATQSTETTQAIQANNQDAGQNNQQAQAGSDNSAQVGSIEEVIEENPEVVSPN